MTGRRRIFLPVVGRHVVRAFLGVFVLTLGAFVAIYLIAEFFDRLDSIIKNDAALGAVVRLFLYRTPLVVTRATPFAVLVGGLVGLGLLARQNEFVALRSCGVSVWQVAVPLLSVAAVISVLIFAWNESVVPYCARRWQVIKQLEIKKKNQVSAFVGRDIWYHGGAGYYSIERVARKKQTLYGLTVYQLGSDFRPTRIIEAAAATWTGTGWKFSGGRTRVVSPGGERQLSHVPPRFTLPETMEDFSAVSVDAEELSYQMLRRQIAELRRKGVDVSESWVDLHLKLALPAASFLMMLVAVPLAAGGTRVSSLAASIGRGVFVGFSYFVVIAFARALGQSGELPPALAAWSANGLFALIGGYYLLGAD